MLRSFAYAASAVELQRGSNRAARRGRMMRGTVPRWVPRRRRTHLLPPGRAAVEQLLAVFELEKAVYELDYEIHNRPEWAAIPVAGISRFSRSTRHQRARDMTNQASDIRTRAAHRPDRCADRAGATPRAADRRARPAPVQRGPAPPAVRLAGRARHHRRRRRWAPRSRCGRRPLARCAWSATSTVGTAADTVMTSLGSSGVWACFVAGVGDGARYKFEIHPAAAPDAQGRSDGVRGRDPAGDGVGRARVAPHLDRRRLDGRSEAPPSRLRSRSRSTRCTSAPGAAIAGTAATSHSATSSWPTSWPRTSSTWASPTSS